MVDALDLQRSEEAMIAEAASRLAGPHGPVSPRVRRTGDHRPVLEHISGPRLSESLKIFGRDSPRLLRRAAALLAHLHAAPPPVSRGAMAETPPWDPVTFYFYSSLTDVQRRVVGVVHHDGDLRAAGRLNDMLALSGGSWCHGDARLDNFFMLNGAPILVDWECSGTGGPEIDISSLLASTLATALREDPSEGDSARAQIERSLHRFRQLVAAVLDGYQEAGGPVLDAELLGRSVGSKLIARSIARAAHSSYDRVTATLLSIGRGLLLHPDRWRALCPASEVGEV